MARFEVYYRDGITGRYHSMEFMASSQHGAILQFYKFMGINSVTYQRVTRIYGY